MLHRGRESRLRHDQEFQDHPTRHNMGRAEEEEAIMQERRPIIANEAAPATTLHQSEAVLVMQIIALHRAHQDGSGMYQPQDHRYHGEISALILIALQ